MTEVNVYHRRIFEYLLKNKSAKNVTEIARFHNDTNGQKYTNAIVELMQKNQVIKLEGEGFSLPKNQGGLLQSESVRAFFNRNSEFVENTLRTGEINYSHNLEELKKQGMNQDELMKVISDNPEILEALKKWINSVDISKSLKKRGKKNIKSKIKNSYFYF